MRFLILACFLIFSLASCSYRSRDILFKEPSAGPASLKTGVSANRLTIDSSRDNVISVDDMLRIVNLQNADLISATGAPSTLAQTLNLTYRVESDSTVAVPVLGKVKLAGLTVLDAEQRLKELYKREFLKDPIIDISILNMNATLLGEVLRPGTYQLTKDKTSLVELLGDAGGFTNRANKTNIKIIRGNKQDPQVIYVDMTDLRALSSPLLNLKKNDIIYVEPNAASQAGDRLGRLGSLVQIGLVFVNTALLIYTFSK